MNPSVDICVLCRGKADNSVLLHNYHSCFSAHLPCIDEKPCVFCGISGLCVRCQHKDCPRTFHPYCLNRYFPSSQSEYELLCETHRKTKGKKKEYQRLWLTRQIANRAGLNPEIVMKIKEQQSDNKAYSICTGQVFWYFIGSQYFPNFIDLQKPELLVNYKIDHEPSWQNGLDQYSDELEKELKLVENANKSFFNQEIAYKGLSCDASKEYREEEIVVAETRNLLNKPSLEEYLKYFESKAKPELEANGNTEKRLSGLREVPKNEEDFVCSICGDGDYEDDDLIVICSACEMGAHMKCYGIPVVPDSDWICHGCKLIKNKEERTSIRCALCAVRGGCVKPTKHFTSGSQSFPNYPEGKNEQVWCHIFCAYQLEPEVFTDRDYLDGIDLTKIDSKRFSLRCQVCNTRNGACLQCQHGRCQLAFHPECGKDFFTNTRDKTGYDEVSIYCSMHKPLKLRRVLEGKEKKSVEDIVNFCKAFERNERKQKVINIVPVKRPQNEERPFTCEEKSKFIKVIDNEIKKVAKGNNEEFEWIVRLKTGSLRNQLQVLRPQRYNLLAPETILQHKLNIKGRKIAECYKFYTSLLYPLMRRELEILKNSVVLYTPKNKKKVKGNNAGGKKVKEKSKGKVKRTGKEEADSPTTVIEIPVIEDVYSTDVYCMCRQPFLEKAHRKPWESENDFEIRREESQMIQCDLCEEWFHYKCVGLSKGSEIPESYLCENCKSRGNDNKTAVE